MLFLILLPTLLLPVRWPILKAICDPVIALPAHSLYLVRRQNSNHTQIYTWMTYRTAASCIGILIAAAIIASRDGAGDLRRRATKMMGDPALFITRDAERLLADGGAVILLLDDAGRLAAQVAQVIELRAADLAAAHDLDRVRSSANDREDALHALAVGNLADGEALVQAAAGAGDADALIGLDAGTVAFADLHVDDDGVARLEFRDRPSPGRGGPLSASMVWMRFIAKILRPLRHLVGLGL